ncbi:MAG: hypothetical protein JWM77_774, partial [Rhodospirillales bacterium]|nr:hypothetical protein [Rhodospirillales bacterium]
TLVQSERDFSALSDRTDTRTAFLAFLAEDGIVFGNDGATNGKTFWQALATPASKLIWRPVYAGIAASGDLGFTTGPFENTRAGAPPRYGWYASVWRLQSDGSWKVVCDLGASVKRPATEPADWAKPDPAAGSTPPAKHDPARSREALMAREREPASYETLAAPDIVVLRDDVEPAVGPAAAIAAIPGGLRREPVAGDVSSAGDLGYVYGKYKAGEASGWYMRVWRRDADAWRVVLESMHQTSR